MSGLLNTILSYILNQYTITDFYEVYERILSLFLKKNTIKFEMYKWTSISYTGKTVVNTNRSDYCKFLWHELVNLVETNKDICEIKEMCVSSSFNAKTEAVKDSTVSSYMFVVSQKNVFILNAPLKLYASIQYETDKAATPTSGSPLSKPCATEKYLINVYSYVTDLKTIKKYIEEKTARFLKEIQDARSATKYIWTLVSDLRENNDEDRCLTYWDETPFVSSKTFDNLFFKNKRETLEKIRFFLNNRKWYVEMGIPYTLGIGLHGPPGTGKTSFIKALANMTGRHIVIISLKFIKTKEQLLKVFFESRYNEDNAKGSILFKDKIIVFEDIDCGGGVIFQRENSLESEPQKADAVNQIIIKSSSDKPTHIPTALTLDDILNVIDGIYENSDRIIVLTSNFYNKLDSALIRPGRIDITLKLENISHDEIAEFYFFAFKTRLPSEETMERLKQIDGQYSPAEMLNKYLLCGNNGKKFIDSLLN